MYADDLISLSLSASHLLVLIKICLKEFNLIELAINVNKSGCMRIGDSQHAQVNSLHVDGQQL